jgi:glutathione S-transferase
MFPILFYGVPEGCSFGSIVALEWSGLAYKLCRIEMPSQVSSSAYQKVNPVAETPTLMTGEGRLISQSVAILHHIGSRSASSGLVPAPGSAGFDRFNEVLAFLNTNFFESFAPLWYAMENELTGSEKETLVRMGQHKVRKAHTDLEALIGNQRWLAGDHRTAADAYFMGIARWNNFHQVLDLRQYPALHAFHERLLLDPAVKFAHAIEHEKTAPVTGGGFAGEVTLEQVK